MLKQPFIKSKIYKPFLRAYYYKLEKIETFIVLKTLLSICDNEIRTRSIFFLQSFYKISVIDKFL